jgi:3-oxoacyl-[acyl-carrier-protein] synthase II
VSDAWVVTGAGLVSPAGDAPRALFGAVVAGARPGRVDAGGLPAVRIHDFQPQRYLARKGLRHLSRTSQLACAAASALAPLLEGLEPQAVGVALGSAWASLDTVVRFEREAHTEGPRFVDPILFTETVANVPAGQISIFFGWSAFNATFSAGTSAGLAAVCGALDFLGEGRASVAVAGGADELNEHLLRTFHAEGLLAVSPDALPFSAAAAGPIGAEGACLLALESAEHAAARGAVARARLDAGAVCFLGTDPSEASPRAAMLEELLARADLAPRDVDLVVLSGNGTPEWDRCEARVVAELFGTAPPPAVAPKAVLGETWGASGPLAIVIAIEALSTSRVPGRPAGWQPAPGLETLSLPPETHERELRHALVVDCSASGYAAGVVVSAARGA